MLGSNGLAITSIAVRAGAMRFQTQARLCSRCLTQLSSRIDYCATSRRVMSKTAASNTDWRNRSVRRIRKSDNLRSSDVEEETSLLGWMSPARTLRTAQTTTVFTQHNTMRPSIKQSRTWRDIHTTTKDQAKVTSNTMPSAIDTTLMNQPPAEEMTKVRNDSTSATTNESFLPPNSASTYATLSSRQPASSLRRILTACLSLSKPRLSFLIVLTTATAYSLYPVPPLLTHIPTPDLVGEIPSLSALTLLYLTLGTALCSGSANAFNMLLEPAYDAQMSRTRNRPLVRKLISRPTAIAFAIASGLAGIGALYAGVNPTVSFLGGLNIVLYAGVYTPLKRISVVNTWVGAVVGGIPPLMGWCAASEQAATGDGRWQELLFREQSAGGWILAGLLFAWQFPHFNSLSWPIREEYRAAGYRMLAWVNPSMNGRVAVRYAMACFPLCAALCWCEITDWGFLASSTVVNGWMGVQAWRFWWKGGKGGSARALFWASVWHLPGVMVLAMLHKVGLWEGVWGRFGEGEGEGVK